MHHHSRRGRRGGGEPWQDWLTRRARTYRQSLLAHRDGARIVASAAWLSPATIQMFNDELAALVDAGTSAPLLVAIREGGTTTGDDTFEHGLRTLIAGTTDTLNPRPSNHPA
ncbi:TetR/AcrR family transcriptional regulator C-terminal domain-containing protein [Lentzea sp. NPDC005914]|uniref:TetR/AcrR family transcriptional regulator C-terminal domain-containing protein n=1 Tax=Lentzea sp. NPDC005914 TaxID=3154572 RepID=UPI0033F62372